ncbi:MAG: hypothetical protein ACM3PP_13060 [Candidatus Saccharibacteria bacterium]
MQPRVVEAFIGEYASGKSELAINRALELHSTGDEVTIVDLDYVEPFYTLRPLVSMLEEKGLNVVGWGREDSFGLGEAGSYVKPAARWVLWRPGHIILDVGYGVHGAATLNLVEGAYESPELKVIAVVNAARPMTSSVPWIVEYINSLGRVDAIVNNTHLGDETDIKFVLSGLHLISEASKIVEIPLIYTVVSEDLKDQLTQADLAAGEFKFIKRYMPGAMW